jgi:Protein of unknown function (DUF1501)
MLVQDLYLQTTRDGAIRRRQFLREVGVGAASVLGLSWTDAVRVQAEDLRKRGMACILLFHNGGPSQYETFDPKPGTEAGGPTKTIKTALPGIEFGEDWPKTAAQLNDIALIRSMTAKEGNHVRAQYLMHTGFAPSAAVKYPNFGSTVAQALADPPAAPSVQGICRWPMLRSWSMILPGCRRTPTCPPAWTWPASSGDWG